LPEEWKGSIIVHIDRSGDKTCCSKYTGILLGQQRTKFYPHSLLSRLTPYAEEIIGDHQCGFRRNRSTTDHICGNKMPTRCNRGFYCRSYCLLNMFRTPLCPSSGAQEYYTVVAACGISCCGFQVAALVWS